MSVWDATKNKDVQITMSTHDGQMLLVHIPRTSGERNIAKLQFNRSLDMFSSTRACVRVRVASAERSATCLSPCIFLQAWRQHTELQRRKVKENIWHLGGLRVHLSDMYHVSFILHNFFDHSARSAAKFAPQCYRRKILLFKMFRPGRPTCLLSYLLIGSTPRDPLTSGR